MRLITLAALLGAFVTTSSFGSGSFSNRRAPGFSLPDVNGVQHDPQDYRGRILIIEIMQTHCPTCKIMSGVLEQVKAKYGAKLQILSVVVPPDQMDQVKAYAKENGVSSPILFDCGQATGSYLRITPQNPSVRFPHVFLIDKDGMIRNDFNAEEAHSNKVTTKVLSAEIDKLLAGTPPKK